MQGNQLVVMQQCMLQVKIRANYHTVCVAFWCYKYLQHHNILMLPLYACKKFCNFVKIVISTNCGGFIYVFQNCIKFDAQCSTSWLQGMLGNMSFYGYSLFISESCTNLNFTPQYYLILQQASKKSSCSVFIERWLTGDWHSYIVLFISVQLSFHFTSFTITQNLYFEIVYF